MTVSSGGNDVVLRIGDTLTVIGDSCHINTRIDGLGRLVVESITDYDQYVTQTELTQNNTVLVNYINTCNNLLKTYVDACTGKTIQYIDACSIQGRLYTD